MPELPAIAHVITGLQVGGAESLLARLAPLQSKTQRVMVICLGPPGPISGTLEAAGITTHHLGAGGLLSLPMAWLRLRKLLKKFRPQVVHTWLYHADLLGGLAARSLRIPVVWALHHAGVAKHELKPATYAIVRLLAKFSARIPFRILACARGAIDSHVAIGYARPKCYFLPNGTDTDTFFPNPVSGATWRAERKLPTNASLIGIAARNHPLKDFPNFFAAVAQFQQKTAHQPAEREVHFLACGQGISQNSPEIATLHANLPFPEKVHLLGPRKDLPQFYNAVDIFTLSSRSEAFPLTLGEAMACGTACVATDVGDTAFLLADTGAVCPAQNPTALAEAWLSLLDRPAAEIAQLGEKARQRIVSEFSLKEMAERLNEHYAAAITPAS